LTDKGKRHEEVLAVEAKEGTGYTSKQMGDASEMLIAAELTLHGVPALKVPDNWPGYDVLAQPPEGSPLRISVKSRTYARSGHFVAFNDSDMFDWLAIVILPNPAEGLSERRFYLAPRDVVFARSYDAPHRRGRGFFVHRLDGRPPSPLPSGDPPTGGWGLLDYRDNFVLSPSGR
jgi:hypothetical protein